MRLGISNSIQSFPVKFTGQVGLVGTTCEADHAACFTGVNIVMEATVVIAATSGIQEGVTDTDHDGLDGEQRVWRSVAGAGSEFIPSASLRSSGGPHTNNA